MKINFEKPIKWSWICLVLFSIIVGHLLYHWRDYRTEKAQEQIEQLTQSANNLAISLSQINRGMSPTYQKQINQILQMNGFPQYQFTSPDTIKGN